MRIKIPDLIISEKRVEHDIVVWAVREVLDSLDLEHLVRKIVFSKEFLMALKEVKG